MSYRILQGDALTVLRTLPAESVHCCVTSPPYWGLRDYKLEPLVWRGERECNLKEHFWGGPIAGSNRGGSGTPTDKNNRGEGYGRDAERGSVCLHEFCRLTAGHVYVHDDGTREDRYGSRPCYRWQMGTHDAALLLRELYPYLRTKRRQAALIWSLYTTLRHKNGHARTPETIVSRRQEIG